LEDATDRELNAIESEFSLVLNSDSCRVQQLFCHLSKPGHPYACFSWGNLKSLKEDPAGAGVDTRAQLQAFYRKNYAAPAMRLCVLGTQSLDELEEYTRASFSPISAVSLENSVEVPLELVSYDGAGSPITDQMKGSVFKIIPIKEIHHLYLSWGLPSQYPHYKSKPAEYLGHLIGHEGEGSVLSILKEKGWATGLSAGVDSGCFDNNTACSIFCVSVYLTEEGALHWQDIIFLLMQYIALLRKEGPQEWIFKELQDTASMQYRFLEESDPDEYASHLAVQMLPSARIEKLDYLRSEYLYQSWNPEIISSFVDLLMPQDMCINLLSKLVSSQMNGGETMESNWTNETETLPKKEPYFGTEYWQERIPDEVINIWATAGLNNALALPQPNPFIPTNFDLCPKENIQTNGTEAGEEDEVGPSGFPKLPNPPPFEPTLLQDTTALKAWHLQDGIFLTPKAEVYLKLVTSEANNSPRNAALSELLVYLIKDSLNEYTYMAEVTQLHYSLKRVDVGFELKVSGFSHKLSVLLQAVFNRVLNFIAGKHLLPSRFAVQKETLLRHYKNSNMKPGSQANNLRLEIIKDKAWADSQKEKDLQGIEISDLEAFFPTLFAQLHIELLIHGNIDEVGARSLCEMVQSEVEGASIPELAKELYPEQKVVCMDPEKHLIYCCPSKDPTEKNSAIVVYWQTQQDSIKERVVLDIIEYLMEEPIYDTLRTKEQLGYSVSCSTRLTSGIGGYVIKVQSASHSPAHIYGRIMEFLKGFKQTLEDLSQETFEENICSLAKAKLQKDMCISEEAGRHWYEIQERRYQFHTNLAEVRELKNATKGDIIESFNKWIAPDSLLQKQLCVIVIGCSSSSNTSSSDDMETECSSQIQNIQQLLSDVDQSTGTEKKEIIPSRSNDGEFLILEEPQDMRNAGVFFENLV